ncbi:hypothetical protein PSM7751_01517 [Pseudooceanicola marinus]|uniref:Uncharacterized protein n=1 Tax=Pseudooceanicola marinus TaxID=396013 RepID=A0A1X6YZE7_9RHOB|nr:hypothetical protein [Pseudooceanicola marinus]PJE32573.1 hypothetical protein CVM50_06645 [Pseudooceanicola marinus]SLN35823.1 hypothetical protein PSM7751_01517 [Pseudooceanicola marinus]
MRPAAAFCLSLPAVLLAGAALARCPTSDDISAGIVYSNTVAGQESINVAFGTTAYLASYYELGDQGLTKQFLMLKGVYPQTLTAITAAEVLTISYHYPVGQAEFPEPREGVSWQVEAVVAQGADSLTETQSYTFGREEEREIGDCTFGVIPYDIETRSEAYGAQVLGMFYVPVLGVAFPDVRRDLPESGEVAFSESMTTYPALLAQWGN